MRKGICFILVLGMLLSLCACQPTPEKEIVANKGDGVLEQRISEAQEQEKQAQREQLQSQASPVPTPTPQPYEYPDTWVLELDLTNYFIHIDATLEVPSAPYPVVRLSQSDFTEKGDILASLMTRVMGETVAKRQGEYCYEDYVDMMEECSRGQYDWNTNTYRRYYSDEQEEADREMAEYAEKLKTALHREQFDEDGTLVTDIGTEYTYCGEDGTQWYARIEENSFSLSTDHHNATSEKYIIWEPDFPGDTTPPPLVITVSQEQAEAEANKVLSGFPGMEWELVKTEQAAMFGDRFFAGDPTVWAAEGYLMTYTRKIGGTSFFNYKEGHDPSRLQLEDAAYAASLKFETLEIFVDEKGVKSLVWRNPLIIEDTVANNLELLPFEQIQDNFVNLVTVALSWINEHPAAGGKLNPTRIAYVKRAVLGYAYVQEKDNPGKFLAVPTWFFTYQLEADLNATGNGALGMIALNAVDGTRVSLR